MKNVLEDAAIKGPEEEGVEFFEGLKGVTESFGEFSVMMMGKWVRKREAEPLGLALRYPCCRIVNGFEECELPTPAVYNCRKCGHHLFLFSVRAGDAGFPSP